MKSEKEESIEFEISKDVKKKVKVKFSKGDLVHKLLNEVGELRHEVEKLKERGKHTPATIKPLKRVWDNEEDDIWREY